MRGSPHISNMMFVHIKIHAFTLHMVKACKRKTLYRPDVKETAQHFTNSDCLSACWTMCAWASYLCTSEQCVTHPEPE